MLKELRDRILPTAAAMIIASRSLAPAPAARAEGAVTYDIFLRFGRRFGWRRVSRRLGKLLLRDVPLPWTLTVPVVNATSPTADGAEVRADWRPNFRTARPSGGFCKAIS